MNDIAATLRQSRALALAALTLATAVVLLLASSQAPETASANSPTIPNANNVRWEPGNAAKTLVVSWGAHPSIPSPCTFSKTSYSIGNPANSTFEDENDDTGSGARSHSYTRYYYWNNNNHKSVKVDFVAGTSYQARVILYAECGRNNERMSSRTSVNAVAPYSGPATGFTASTGDASGEIDLSWTNPTTASGVSVTKREYRAKLSSASAWPNSWTQAGTSTSFTITGLTGGSNYDIQFRVQTNSVPTKTLSATSVRAYLASVGSISTPAATSGSANGEIDLTWSAATSATSYEYQSKKSTDSNWGAWTSAGTGTSKTITGLDQAVIYEFRLRGKTATANGPTSSSVAAVAQFTPTASASAGATQKSIDISITAPQGLSLTRYDIRWKLNTAGSYPSTGTGSWTSVGTATSHTISALTGATAYNVQVRVVHTSGDPASTTSLVKTINVSSSPAVKPPTNFAATAGTQFGSVNLSWSAPSGQTVTRYEFRYRKNGGSYSATWTAAGTASTRATTTSQTVTGLKTDGTSYDFQLRTVASGGNSVSVGLTTVLPKPLAAPTNLAASAGSAKGTIGISWTGVTGFTPTRYEYRWKETSTNAWPTSGATGDWTPAGTSSTRSTATSATITGLTANASYNIQLRTVEGTAPNYSAAASATANSRAVGPPTGFAAAQGTVPGSISISWTDPTGETITSRQYRTKVSGDSTVYQGAWASAGTTSPFTVAGLDASVQHDIQFRVGANGGHSVAVTASATSGLVPPPTNVQASQGANMGEIDLAWSAPNGITVGGYRYRSKKSSALTYPNNWESISASSTTATLTGLMGNVEHNIQLSTVFRVSGRSTDSYSIPVTVSAIAKPIPPPSNPDAEETASPGVIVLQWAPPGNVEAHGFQFRYKPNGESGQTWSQWFTVNGGQSSTQVNGLEVGIGYQFELTAQNGPLGNSPPVQFALQASPAETPTGLVATGGVRMITLTWDTPAEGASTGHRYRYRATDAAADAWSDWVNVDLSDAGSQSTLIYGLKQATEYTVELTSQRGATFSEAVTATAITNLDIPRVTRITPHAASVSVTANSRIALEVDVFDSQNGPANQAIDEKTGIFKGVNALYDWTETAGGGSFDDPGNTRRVVYTAPSSPGIYTVAVTLGPRGICTAHYGAAQEVDPCQASFTVRVSADVSSNGRGTMPTNPPGTIPTTLTDAAGNSYNVFTPEQGGSYRLDGAAVTAYAGAVADNTIIGVRIEAVNGERTDPNGQLELADTTYRVVGVNAQSQPLSGHRLNTAIPICLPIPDQFAARLNDVMLAKLGSDGSVAPIGQRVAPSAAGTVVCATVAELPSSYIVVARNPVQEPPEELAVVIDTGDAEDALLPDAGGFAAGPMLALFGLLSAVLGGILFIGGTRLNRYSAHRGAHR